jgi:uncharacterized protein (TIGR04255 family)
MPDWIRFPNAPITEALLDIRVKLPKQVNLARLEAVQVPIKERYPFKQSRLSGIINVEIKKEASQPEIRQSSSPDGFFFASPDKKQILQARLDGFTFSKLKPYDRWETFRDEARELWRLYVETVSPDGITRLALRYINRIEIPLPMRDFKDYILTTPEIAPGLPQGMAHFFMRLVIPEEKMKATAIVTQTMEPVADKGTVLPVIFDIDVFRVVQFSNEEIDEAWRVLEGLRDLKNEIFFKSITPKAMELFQ